MEDEDKKFDEEEITQKLKNEYVLFLFILAEGKKQVVPRLDRKIWRYGNF